MNVLIQLDWSLRRFVTIQKLQPWTALIVLNAFTCSVHQFSSIRGVGWPHLWHHGRTYFLQWPLVSCCSSLEAPAVSRTHSFVFFAVQETRRIVLSQFISKARLVFILHLRVKSMKFTLGPWLDQSMWPERDRSGKRSMTKIEWGRVWMCKLGVICQEPLELVF